MKYFLLTGYLFLVLGGCGSGSKNLEPYVQKLQWLDAADPQKDAEQAIKVDDLRLLGLAQRSVNIPGVTKEDSYKYEKKCGVQLIEGISDVVRSDEHLRLMQKARSYALKYNAIIKTECKP
ncbi:MAG: glutamyl-tRNA amidotransferase [Gammaproteobacteria bacterium]|nr:glutamyl-tRNA amidotransferase [Gammaproteobacteria bacterium]